MVSVSVHAVADDSPISHEAGSAADGDMEHCDSHACASCKCLQLWKNPRLTLCGFSWLLQTASLDSKGRVVTIIIKYSSQLGIID